MIGLVEVYIQASSPLSAKSILEKLSGRYVYIDVGVSLFLLSVSIRRALRREFFLEDHPMAHY